MSKQNIEGRLGPGIGELFNEGGQLSGILDALTTIDETQIGAGSLDKNTAIKVIIDKLSLVFDSMRNTSRALDMRKIQSSINLTPTIGDGIHAFGADQLMFPTTTYLPGPTDFVFVAHNYIAGTAIAFEEGRTSEKLAPAVSTIIKRGIPINIVDALFGNQQLSVSDWYEKPTFERQVSDKVEQTVDALINLDRRGVDSDRSLLCFASGLYGFSDEHFSNFAGLMTKAVKKTMPRKWTLKTDFQRIGSRHGWIYGGVNTKYPTPTPFAYSK